MGVGLIIAPYKLTEINKKIFNSDKCYNYGMDLKKFFHKYILGRKYYRSGKCNRCGACCTKIHVRTSKSVISSIKEFERLKFFDVFYSYLEPIGEDEYGVIFKCKNFDPEKRICVIHKNRPSICRRYPDEVVLSEGGALSEDCGFVFTPIDSFEDVLKSVENKSRKF